MVTIDHVDGEVLGPGVAVEASPDNRPVLGPGVAGVGGRVHSQHGKMTVPP